MNEEKQQPPQSVQLFGRTYIYAVPLSGKVEAFEKIRIDIAGEIPAVLKEKPPRLPDDPTIEQLDRMNDYQDRVTEAAVQYRPGYNKRLRENWPAIAKIMFPECDDELANPDNLTFPEMNALIVGFSQASDSINRSVFGA